MEKSRLHYIDIIKGVCVALVIVRHAPFVMGFADNPYMDVFWLKNFFIPFFMAAFFMVTGFCSNYDRPFLPFLWRNVKGILIPAFCLYYLNRWLENFNTFLFAENPTWLTLGHWLSPGIRTFIADGGHYWFLSALFLAKTALWPLHRMKSDVAMLSLAVAISFCGVWLGNAYPQHNFFFLFNAMVLLPFLALGKMTKSKCKQILNWGGVRNSVVPCQCGAYLRLWHGGSKRRTHDRHDHWAMAFVPRYGHGGKPGDLDCRPAYGKLPLA